MNTPYFNSYAGAPFLGDTEGILKLRALVRSGRDAISKATTYQIGTPPDSGNDLVSFLPEDLSKVFAEQTRGDMQIVATKQVPTVTASSTQHYMTVQQSDGDTPYIPNFQAETGLSGLRTATATKPYVYLKQHADRRQSTETAQQVGLIGGLYAMGVPQVKRDGLAKMLRDAVRAKRKAFERDLLWASSEVNDLEFDSIPDQIDVDGIPDLNVFDLRGAALTWEYLFDKIALNAGSKYGTMTEKIWLTPRQWGQLGIQANDSGRWDRQYTGKAVPEGKGWVFNPSAMGITGPLGQFIKLDVVPFLDASSIYEYITSSVGTPAQTVTIANQTSAAAGGSGSYFTSTDAGDYIYGVVAIFANGSSAGYTTAAIPVTAGQEVTITMNDSAIGTSDNPLYAYAVFRSSKDGDDTTLKFLKRYPVKNSGGHTVMVDDNSVLPGTDKTLGLQIGAREAGDGGAINIPTLLEPVRFPLPVNTFVGVQQITLSIQAPKVWLPYRQILIKNCGVS